MNRRGLVEMNKYVTVLNRILDITIYQMLFAVSFDSPHA